MFFAQCKLENNYKMLLLSSRNDLVKTVKINYYEAHIKKIEDNRPYGLQFSSHLLQDLKEISLV